MAGGPGGLRVDALRKSYQLGPDTLEILKGITFSLSPGESLAITGPSGCGKSTLLHILGTLDRPTSGTVEIDGVIPHDLPEPRLAAFRNRRIGFVFQDHHLLPQYTVLENVLVPVFAAKGPGDATAVQRAKDLLSRVGLSNRMHHRPAEISGGERQRAAVARALINSPSVVLCDEPTGNLDEKAAGDVADLLFALHRAEGIAPGEAKILNILIVVTHSAQLARRFGRRVRLSEGVCSEA